ncbi:hypothetical protein V8G54_025100 [Vigna mungo]|uniref:Disease resistance RPP13-like protein 1 n=1 Tax=Vigna mungo TaxID=3915 RepID=A0AAQ3RTT1_VIGMU
MGASAQSSWFWDPRNEKVALTMRSEKHLLQVLKEDYCWDLFAKHAFQSANSHSDPDFIEIGKKIVKKCNGLPLSLKTMRSLLHNKSSLCDWESIMKSEIWDFSENESDILPALRLSYLHLPPHLKKCFAFCGLFPKGHRFDRDLLIQLWMAENFLESPSQKKSPQEIGEQLGVDKPKGISKITRHCSFSNHGLCFDGFGSLIDAQKLHTFTETTWSGSCKISINDLFSKFKCIRVLSLARCDELTEVPESVGNLKHLRSLNFSYSNIEKLPDSLSLFYKLQILKLNYCLKLEELPLYLHQLDNLRRLEFVQTRVKNVPAHLGKLKDLQVLMSSFCVKKSKEFGILQLGELDLHGSLIIDELHNIENPSDALEANLKNKLHVTWLALTWKLIVGSPVDSTKVENVIENLRPSKCLKKLSVRNYVGKQFPNWLLNNSLPNLVYLGLHNCKNCRRFPPLGLLPFLKELMISECDAIVNIDADFHGNNSCSFKSLEKLELSCMVQWEKWECKAVTGAFPRLQHLSIDKCPKLKGHLPEKHFPLITLKITCCQQLEASTPRTIALEVHHCGKLQFEWATMKSLRMSDTNTEASLLENITSDISLQHMDIYSSLTSMSVNSVSLRTFSLDFFPKLRTLSITEFPNLQTISQDHLHNHLQNVTITKCPKFESFPTNMHTLLPSLTKLHIADCPRLESFPKGGLPSNLKCMSLNNCSRLVGSLKGAFGANALLEMLSIEEVDAECFPEEGLLPLSLTELMISGCPNLKEIDHKGLYQLSSLQTLRLLNCPNLQRLPAEGLPKSISHLQLWDCPNLKEIDHKGLYQVSSFQTLKFLNCPNLLSLPAEDLP